MTAPAVRPESATLPTKTLGYVDIINFRPPAGARVPDGNDPEVQALLARTNERRAPEEPVRVLAVDGGFELADIESYRAWWALRHTGTGIGTIKRELVELVEDVISDAPAAAESERPAIVTAPKSTSPTRVPLDALIVDPGLQTRAAMNDAIVAEYADLLLAGSGIGTIERELVELVEDAISDAPAVAESERPAIGTAPKSTSPTRVPLDALIVDLGLQTRAAMNDATVAEYAEALLAGETLPPVVLFSEGEEMWLADGFHRVAAARQAGKTDVEAIVHAGGWREALLHAVKANARHGLRRTNADKRRAVELVVADAEWGAMSSNWIAHACGVSQPFVAQVREATSNRLKCSAVATADGRVMETAKIGRKAAPIQVDSTLEGTECSDVNPTALQLGEVIFRPSANVPANDDAAPVEPTRKDAAPVTVPVADDDADGAPDARQLAGLDRAGATLVRLLTALAVDHPRAARMAAARYVAAIEAAMNVQCRAPAPPGPAPSQPLQAVDATASGPSDPPELEGSRRQAADA